MILPNTKVVLNLSWQTLQDIVKLYWVLSSRLIRAEEAVVTSSGPIGGGGETVTRYSVFSRSELCSAMKLKIPTFCWIDAMVSCAEVKLESETVFKIT